MNFCFPWNLHDMHIRLTFNLLLKQWPTYLRIYSDVCKQYQVRPNPIAVVTVWFVLCSSSGSVLLEQSWRCVRSHSNQSSTTLHHWAAFWCLLGWFSLQLDLKTLNQVLKTNHAKFLLFYSWCVPRQPAIYNLFLCNQCFRWSFSMQFLWSKHKRISIGKLHSRRGYDLHDRRRCCWVHCWMLWIRC